MRGRASIAVAVLVFGAVALLARPRAPQPERNVEQPAKATSSTPSTTTAPPATALARPAADAENIQKELLADADQLEMLVHDAGLDGDELNDRYNEMSEEMFYDSLPARVREGYRALHTKVRRLQELDLKRDGMTPEFFDQRPESAPAWVVRQALALERTPLPPAVVAFNAQIGKADAISNADIQRVAELCAGDRACLQKSAYEWIKSNHQLDDEQLKLFANF